jgi:hypothetical protein
MTLTDSKIQNAYLELSELDSVKSQDENYDNGIDIQVLRLPTPRAKKIKHLNSNAKNNSVLDTIRFCMDGLASEVLFHESIIELLNLSDSNINSELMIPYLKEIFKRIGSKNFIEERDIINLFLLLSNCLTSVLNIKVFVSECLLEKLLDGITNYDSIISCESKAFKMTFKELGQVQTFDLTIWVISKYFLEYEMDPSLKLQDSNALLLLKRLLLKKGLLNIREGTLKVISSILKFWVTNDTVAAVNFLSQIIEPKDLYNEILRGIIITASGFIYGAKELFKANLVPPTDLEDELSLSILVNYVDRFIENRPFFPRSHYLSFLEKETESGEISFQLYLLLGFLYEFDAHKALSPEKHSLIKGKCKFFYKEHKEFLDPESRNALEQLLINL